MRCVMAKSVKPVSKLRSVFTAEAQSSQSYMLSVQRVIS